MAAGKVTHVRGKRHAWIKQGTGKLRNRFCVGVKIDQAHKSAAPGVKLMPVEFHGCFKHKADAVKRAESLAQGKAKASNKSRKPKK